jgi:hypothetical protein
MKITPVSSKFLSPNFSSSNSQTKPIFQNDEQKIKTGLVALGVIGAATVTYAVLKHNNLNPLKQVQNFVNKFTLSSKEDEVNMILKGKRDEEAYKKYKAYIAEQKIDSLNKKLLNGQFSKTSDDAILHITRNAAKLRKEAGVA